MQVTFSISGGYLKIERKLFTKGMLVENSPIRTMIYGDQEETLKNPPSIAKHDGWVKIDYNNAEDIMLESSGDEFLKKLKNEYHAKIKGLVTIKMMSFEAYFTMFNLDDPNEIKIVK